MDSETKNKFLIEELESQQEELNAAIEELKNNNDLLNRTLDQLEERNKELNQLVYKTSHDLKSPITSIYGLIYLIRQEPISDRVVEYIDMADQMMNNMERVLKSVAMFNKATIDELHFGLVPAIDLLNKIVNSFSQTHGFNEIHFHLDVNPEMILKTDLTLLDTALTAIVENAIFYRNTEAPDVLISITKTWEGIIITVVDNGEGIEKEILEKAFDMFYRGNNKSKGFGLGLYIAKKIITRMGGTIELLPQLIGLKVEIHLPD